jgi:hypothetical protein
MIARRLLFLTLWACGIPSCVQDHAERLYMSLPPTQGSATVLYSIPSRKYSLVADIQWNGGNVNKMASRAASLGGDAVIIQFLGGNVDFSSISPEQANQSNSTYTRMAGSVIKYQ